MIDEKLIQKLLQGQCTPAELEQLQQLLKLPAESGLDEILQKYWELAELETENMDDAVSSRMWTALQTVQDVEPQQLKVSSINKFRWSAAAAIVLVLSVGALSYLNTGLKNQLITQSNSSLDPVEVQLIDGSKIWLNNQGEITYKEEFVEDSRKVTLKGEAFFEVAKDPERPFIVETEQLITKVLGTSFNLKTDTINKIISVALIEGSVEIQIPELRDTTVLLEPGEQYVYNYEKGDLEKLTFQDEAKYAWKDGILFFDKAPVKKVAEQLSEWYDIKVKIENESAITDRLQAKFDTKDLSLKDIVKKINGLMEESYTLELISEKELIIKPM